MNLREVQRNWNVFGETDPYWAILTEPSKIDNRWDPREFFESGRWEIDTARKCVEELAPGLRRGSALDFGCGLGRLTQALALHFDRAVGVDIAPSMIARARELNTAGERCEFLLNDRADLGAMASSSFDFVYSLMTLQHIPPRYSRRYLREFVRVLAPGGVLVAQLPARRVLFRHRAVNLLRPAKRWCGKLFRPGAAAMEMYGMGKQRVRDLLESAGCEILSILPDGAAGASWEGFRYYARKTRA